MQEEHRGRDEEIIHRCVDALTAGRLPPWKVEEEVERLGVTPPHHYLLAALSRRRFIEAQTGEPFQSIRLSDKPYKL